MGIAAATSEPVAMLSTSAIYETPRPSFSFEEINENDYDDDDDDVFVEDDARAFGKENVGPVASPYILPYLYNRRYLDTQYGIRRDGDPFKIGL